MAQIICPCFKCADGVIRQSPVGDGTFQCTHCFTRFCLVERETETAIELIYEEIEDGKIVS